MSDETKFDMMSNAEFAALCRTFDKQQADDDDFAFDYDATLYSTRAQAQR
jgi:hypothetical protein